MATKKYVTNHELGSKIAKTPADDFRDSCKGHVDGKDKLIWLCYDCRKFTCTKCYAKDHKRCYADLT